MVSEDEFVALERRRLLEDKRLDCITYRRDASHSQVVEFLRAVSQRMEPGADVEAPFAGERQQPRVFISGSYREKGLLGEVGEVARQAGFDVWFAETQVSAGDRIVDVIAKAIDQADCLIAVLSEDSAASSWVHFEIGRAFGARKKVLPIRVGEAPVPSDLMGLAYLQVNRPALTPGDRARIMTALRSLLKSEMGS